VQSFVLYISQL